MGESPSPGSWTTQVELGLAMHYPPMFRVRQRFSRPRVDDLPGTVARELARLELGRSIRPGDTVALTAGSRGIANIPIILKAVADVLKDLGARPFLVPAMGSHGGGTAQGQRKILESYGITEDFVGVPIHASMEVVSLGTTTEGYPLFLDRHASEADHIGVVARIKPHTGFHGPIESGLLKMLMIGLGKHEGAIHYHRVLLDLPYDSVVRSVAKAITQRAPVRFGLAIVENAYDETALLEAIAPRDFESREEVLLVRAKEWLARLPLREADLLIVDEIGKDISGSGMDTNVVGRKRSHAGQPTLEQPWMRHIFVRGLSAKTHGNATGIGSADFTTRRLVQAMDYDATVVNCLTAGYPQGAKVPVTFDTDREVIEAALKILGAREPHEARVVRIRNTLALEKIELSEPCLEEASRNNDLEVLEGPKPLSFTADGNLPPW